MITLHTLASGSEGNCLLLCADGVHILVDIGISCRRISHSLQQLGLTLADIDAVLITHSHSDHIAGLQTLVKKYAPVLYASGPAGRQIAYRVAGVEPLLRQVEPGDVFSLGTVHITVFPTSHDAPGSVDYRMDHGGSSVGILTDTGYIPDEAADILRGVDLLILESNHDVEMLKNGPYPHELKQRILGNRGHLSNETAARFACETVSYGTRQIILAHLSNENNTPELAMAAFSRLLSDGSVEVTVAPRGELSHCYRIGDALCRK